VPQRVRPRVGCATEGEASDHGVANAQRPAHSDKRGVRFQSCCADPRCGRRSHPTDSARVVPQFLRYPAKNPTAGAPIRALGRPHAALFTPHEGACAGWRRTCGISGAGPMGQRAGTVGSYCKTSKCVSQTHAQGAPKRQSVCARHVRVRAPIRLERQSACADPRGRGACGSASAASRRGSREGERGWGTPSRGCVLRIGAGTLTFVAQAL